MIDWIENAGLPVTTKVLLEIEEALSLVRFVSIIKGNMLLQDTRACSCCSLSVHRCSTSSLPLIVVGASGGCNYFVIVVAALLLVFVIFVMMVEMIMINVGYYV